MISSFSFFLIEVTRLILINPQLINHFSMNRKEEISGAMYTDYLIFSNLLRLLEMDTLITNYEYKN